MTVLRQSVTCQPRLERSEMPADAAPRYLPATRWRIFTRLYDPVLALAMRERRFRGLMRQRVSANLPAGGTAVDVGCGTGTFATALASERTDAEVIGVDGDTEILTLAENNPGAEAVAWPKGVAQALPLANYRAAVVTMSLMLPHLPPHEKREAL